MKEWKLIADVPELKQLLLSQEEEEEEGQKVSDDVGSGVTSPPPGDDLNRTGCTVWI